jgi:hypothetical protein
VLKGLLELERLARDDQHLDVGNVVGDAARDAAGQDHFLHDVRRKRVGNALRVRAQLLTSRRRHTATLDADRTLSYAPTP